MIISHGRDRVGGVRRALMFKMVPSGEGDIERHREGNAQDLVGGGGIKGCVILAILRYTWELYRDANWACILRSAKRGA